MQEQQPANVSYGYDMTKFVLNRIPTVDWLQSEDGRYDEQFVACLRDVMERSDFTDVLAYGSYAFVRRPIRESADEPPVAVKLFTYGSEYTQNFDTAEERLRRSLHIHSGDNTAFDSYLSTGALFGSLTMDLLDPDERNFVAVAFAHRIHEELFPEWLLPTYFFTFRTPYTLPCKDTCIPKGDTVFACAQSWVNFRGVLEYNPWDLTLHQQDQVRQFYARMKYMYEEYGYVPDVNLNEKRQNLGFDEVTGKLVFIDTTYITRYTQDEIPLVDDRIQAKLSTLLQYVNYRK